MAPPPTSWQAPLPVGELHRSSSFYQLPRLVPPEAGIPFKLPHAQAPGSLEQSATPQGEARGWCPDIRRVRPYVRATFLSHCRAWARDSERLASADSHGVPERNEVLPGAVLAPWIVLEWGVLPGVAS